MLVAPSSETEAEIERLVASGLYADATEVVETAVRLLAERERKLRWLHDELAIADEQVRRGEVVELTRERFQAIKRRAFENAGRGKPIKDAVKP